MVADESSNAATKYTTGEQPLAPWQERLLDAEEIRSAAALMKRPTARMHLETLAKRLQKESDALKRVENSHSMVSEEKKEDSSSSSSPSPKPLPTAAPKVATPPVVSSSVKYVPIDRFAFDAGGYNAPFVTLYIDLPAVGSIPRENIQCDFKTSSFDLIVKDLRGKSYRLFKDSLEKDIDTAKSKLVVKADKIIVKLAKVKQSDYGGYDYWSKLTDTKTTKFTKKEDPQSSIMSMMKQMYDEGDDNMKKIIGETMMKQQTGELGKDKGKFGGDMNDF
jgi:calcyclin binding protein